MLEVLKETGVGRTFVVLFDRETYRPYAERLHLSLSERVRCFLLFSKRVDNYSWSTISSNIVELLRDKQIRQVSFVVFESAGLIALDLALNQIKLVRSIVFVDPSFRSDSSYINRHLSWLEDLLPMGLPFRSKIEGFDAKPFLQRVRCPSLVVKSGLGGSYSQQQGDLLANHLPVSWKYSLTGEDDEISALCDVVGRFQEVPAKCPQKNR
ncbi:MAG: hypothetical protein KDD42_05755 [Bdellovibrionales bacterium]|nr:hypothetical protein [Bdellovibrionales bacterium]